MLPKFRVLSGKDVCAILSQHGFERVRQKGSHVVTRRRTRTTTFTVPVPMHSELKRGTLKGVVDLSGLPVELFEEQTR